MKCNNCLWDQQNKGTSRIKSLGQTRLAKRHRGAPSRLDKYVDALHAVEKGTHLISAECHLSAVVVSKRVAVPNLEDVLEFDNTFDDGQLNQLQCLQKSDAQEGEEHRRKPAGPMSTYPLTR